jgi:hypothetical protein
METDNEATYLWRNEGPVNWIQCRQSLLSVPFSYTHLPFEKRWSKTYGKVNIPHHRAIPLPAAVPEREQWQLSWLASQFSGCSAQLVQNSTTRLNPWSSITSRLFLLLRRVLIFPVNWISYPNVWYSYTHVKTWHNEEIHDLQSSRNTTRTINSRQFRSEGNMACSVLDMHKVLIGKPEEKLPRGERTLWCGYLNSCLLASQKKKGLPYMELVTNSVVVIYVTSWRTEELGFYSRQRPTKCYCQTRPERIWSQSSIVTGAPFPTCLHGVVLS